MNPIEIGADAPDFTVKVVPFGFRLIMSVSHLIFGLTVK
jgi:hypothetical protein